MFLFTAFLFARTEGAAYVYIAGDVKDRKICITVTRVTHGEAKHTHL